MIFSTKNKKTLFPYEIFFNILVFFIEDSSKLDADARPTRHSNIVFGALKHMFKTKTLVNDQEFLDDKFNITNVENYALTQLRIKISSRENFSDPIENNCIQAVFYKLYSIS